MTSLEAEIMMLTRVYVRKGGKANRRQQQARMLEFARSASANGAKHLAQVGRGQVIAHWKTHSHLSDATLYAHWLAIRELFRLAGKQSEPPRPRTRAQCEKRGDGLIPTGKPAVGSALVARAKP